MALIDNITKYEDPETGKQYTMTELGEADFDVQTRAMRHWFLRNFEDPAERTPYDSGEGGYIWIWGGPYNPDDVLTEQFSEHVPVGTIASVAGRLIRETGQFAPVEQAGDYDDDLRPQDSTKSRAHEAFLRSMDELRSLLIADVGTAEPAHLRMLYAYAITLLETYLADAFKHLVFLDASTLRKYVKSSKVLKETKVSLSDAIDFHDQIERRTRQQLDEVLWHNLPTVRAMYAGAFDDFGFPNLADLKSLMQAVSIRHDIVHRNGKGIDRSTVKVDREIVENLVEKLCSFVAGLDEEVMRIESEVLVPF